MKLRLAALGAISLWAQVVLLRELTVALYGSELVILLGVGLWLLGTGLGAAAGRYPRRGQLGTLAFGLTVFGILLPLLVLLARGSRLLWGGVLGAYLAFPTQLLVMLTIMLPAALLSGWMFTHAARLATDEGRTLAGAYAAECAGGLVGGAAATVLLASGMSNLTQALSCGILAAATAMTIPRGRVLAMVSLLLLAIGLGGSPRLNGMTIQWNHPDLLRTRDTPYGRVTAEERSGQLIVFVDDALAFENEGTTAEEFVQLASLQVPSPRRVLVLGGAAAGLLAEARRLDAQELVYVEMDRAMLQLMRALPADLGLGQETEGRAPEVVVADPRRYVRRARGFDLILVGAPEPASGRENRFYTCEFFDTCAAALSPGGVLALRLPGGQNVWTPIRLHQIAGIQRALAQTFASVVVMPGYSTLLLASPLPLPRTAAPLVDRLRSRSLDNRLVTPAYLEYIYTNDRFTGLRARLARADVSANSDRHPACYRRTLLLWISRFYPTLGWHDLEPPGLRELVKSAWFWIVTVLGLALLVGLRRGHTWRRPLALGAAGAAGMTLEAALILDYQVRVGALFQDLGLLLCLFMVGMAVGAAIGARRSHAATSWRELVYLPASALMVTLLLNSVGLGSLLAAGTALAVCAAAVGMAFASLTRAPGVRGPGRASTRSSDEAAAPSLEPARVAPFLAADLIGSSLGCLVAGLVLIPIWGPVGAATAAVVLGLFVLLS